MEKTRYLLLENGTVFKGKAFGAEGDVTGEVVFTTAMTGYIETLTDPSYYGQIVVQTFPLIGNYGIIPEDFESRKSFVKGYIVRDWCQEPSNFRNQGDLDTFLREQNVPGLYGIDTRALTKIVRENGVMNGMILSELPQETSSDSDVVWSTFVGHDMKALGQKAGETAVEYLDTLGKEDPVCLFISRPTSGQASSDRFEGFKETVLAKYPDAKIIEEGDTGAGTRDSAQTLMENVLQRESEIDVVCGHNDAEVVGAYNAATAQGRDEIKFIGIAGDVDVLGWLQDGNESWLGEVLQNPVVLGYQATDAIIKVLLDNEELPEKYDLPEPEVITPSNISDYDWKNWEWLG